MEVNSKEYWEERFKTDDWDNADGSKQTTYFAELAGELLPEWFVKNIRKYQYQVCDLGCAEGNAEPTLVKLFPQSEIIGIDISSAAVKKAGEKYKFAKYKTGDMFNRNGDESYDVIFCSNVIEHFDNFHNTLEHICAYAKHYTIIMCPLRENFDVPEHMVIIDTKSIPCIVDNNYLIYAKSTIGNIEYYGGEQILLIYSKDPVDQNNTFLADLADGVRSIEYNESEKAWKRMNDELYCTRENMKNLELQVKEKEREVQEEVDKRVALLETREKLEQEREEHNEFWNELKNKIIKNREEKLFEQKELQEEIEGLKAEVENLDVEKTNLINEIHQLGDNRGKLLDDNRIKLSEEMIEKVMKTKSYMSVLYVRRFIDQFLMGPLSEKKDFLKFTSNKLFKTKYGCKGSQSFDLLSTASMFLAGLENEQRQISAASEDKPVYKELPSLKNTCQIFIFTGVPFYDVGGGQRCSQLTKVFDKMGYEVHYIYAYESSESKKFDLFNPALTHTYLGNLTQNRLLKLLKGNSVFIFEAPYVGFLPYLNLGKKCHIPMIYEHIDNWESSLGCLLYDKESFLEFMEKSDYLVATSVELVKQLKSYTDKDIEYLPNAVDINIFEPAYQCDMPKDLVKGKNKTLLYFGSLWGEWFDWDLLIAVAKRTSDSTYNMIGDYAAIQEKIADMPSNIHFLGMKKQIELPAYLKYSDIAILPFKNCEIGKYVSPLKIFEYIAMNKYVLSEPLPDVIGYPNALCSDNADEWVKAIEEDIEVTDCSEFISKNSWYDRCEKLLNLSAMHYLDTKKYKNKISVIVLNHNNDKVIHRCVASLLSHNERYDYQVIVVDNASTDGSVEKLRQKFGDSITILQNDKNGCSSGRNIGVNNATGEIIVFLDSDQWVISDSWLDAGIWILENRKGIGAVSWGAGWFTSEDCRGPIVDYFENRAIASEVLYRTDVSYLATSGFIMRKDLFEAVGGFDEYYDPTCFEDTDLTLAINDFGLQTVYCPYLNIMHLPHQTTESGSKKHTELFNRNSAYFIEKWKKKNPELFARVFNGNC